MQKSSFLRHFSYISQEIQSETDIPEKDLMRAIQALAVGKIGQRILCKEPKNKEIGKFSVFMSSLCHVEENKMIYSLFI